MKKSILVSLAILVLAVVVIVHSYMSDRGRWTTDAQYIGLARSVADNELVSLGDPGIVMGFHPSFRHIGGQKFVLYGVADTEQHFFVETDADNRLKSFYWVQFEAYLPDNSYHYDYEDSPSRLRIGDYDFYMDTEAVQSNPEKRRRGTDGARAREFLDSKGYAVPQNFAYARLVHLTDASRRKELMVIFIEDLAPLGLSGAELQQGGEAAHRWPEIEDSHIEKIRNTMTLARPRESGSDLNE